MFNKRNFVLLFVMLAAVMAVGVGSAAAQSAPANLLDANVSLGGANVARWVVSGTGCGVFPGNGVTVTFNSSSAYNVRGARYSAGTGVSNITNPFSSVQQAAAGAMAAPVHQFGQLFPVSGTSPQLNGMWFELGDGAIDLFGNIGTTQVHLVLNQQGCWLGLVGDVVLESSRSFVINGGVYTPGGANGTVSNIVGPFPSITAGSTSGSMATPSYTFDVTLPNTGFTPQVDLIGILFGGNGGMTPGATGTPQSGMVPAVTVTPVASISSNPADCLTRDVEIIDQVTIVLKSGCALSGDFTHINGTMTSPALDSIAATGRFIINESGADLTITMWNDGAGNIADANLAAAGYATDRIANMMDVLPNCDPAVAACSRGVQVFQYPATGAPTVRWMR